MNPNLSNQTKIARIVTFFALTFGLSTIFYVKIIKGGEGIAPWVLPLMLCPSVSAIITKLIFDRNLKGLGWKPGPAKWLGLAYLLPILYGAVVYGIVWMSGWAASQQMSSLRWWVRVWLTLPVGRWSPSTRYFWPPSYF